MDEIAGKAVVKVGLDDTQIKQGLTNLNAKMKLADETWKSSLATFNKSDRSIEKLTTDVLGNLYLHTTEKAPQLIFKRGL